MMKKLEVPQGTKLRKTVFATAGAVGLMMAIVAPVGAVDWPQPLPENEFGSPAVAGTHSLLPVYEDGPAQYTNDGAAFRPNPLPTPPSSGTGVFQPFYTVHRSTGACNNSHRCITYTDPVSGATVSDVKVEGGFNTGHTPSSQANYEMVRSSAEWTRAVTMGEFNITPGQAGYIELLFDTNETGAAGSTENKIVISELQVFIGANLDDPEASGLGPDGTGYTGGTFDTDDGSSPNTLWDSTGTVEHMARWTLDNPTNNNVDILLDASICDCKGQGGSGKGDMSIFIPIASLGNFSDSDNFVLYTENLFVDDGYTEIAFRVGAVERIPEPASLALLGIGIIGLGYVRRRRAGMAARAAADASA